MDSILFLNHFLASVEKDLRCLHFQYRAINGFQRSIQYGADELEILLNDFDTISREGAKILTIEALMGRNGFQVTVGRRTWLSFFASSTEMTLSAARRAKKILVLHQKISHACVLCKTFSCSAIRLLLTEI